MLSLLLFKYERRERKRLKPCLNNDNSTCVSKSVGSKATETLEDLVFTKRAILLVAFMLRNSKVTQEVRNQALNIIENSSDEAKMFEITKERELLMAITFAENPIDRATATSVYVEYTNRHKKILEETIEKHHYGIT